MPNGYRFIIVAVGGIALCAALFLGAYFGSLYSPDNKQYQSVAGNQGGQGDYQGPSQSLPDVSGLPSPIERAIANPRPTTGVDHEKRDLAAQEASALWAFYMVVASFASVLITAIGTAFLYKQIVLTREAVEDTGLATAAMVRQNELAEMGQRPWLTIEEIDFKLSGYLHAGGLHVSIIVEIKVRNVGSMPALNVSYYCTPIQASGPVRPIVEQIYSHNRKPRTFIGRNIAPNATSAFVVTTAVDIEGATSDVGALPPIYVPISFIYNAAQRDPPLETSATYWIGKIIQGQSMRPFPIQELLAAPQFDGERLGGLSCESSVIETGHMI